MIELRIFNTLVRFFIMMKNSKTKYYSFSIYQFHEGIENKGLRCQVFWDFPLYSGHAGTRICWLENSCFLMFVLLTATFIFVLF